MNRALKSFNPQTPMQINPFALLLLFPALILGALSVFSWRRRNMIGGLEFFRLMLAMLIYTLGYMMELSSRTLPDMLFWTRVEYLAIAPLPALWIWFALRYAGHKAWLGRRLLIFFILPLVIITALYTNDWHHLYYTYTSVDTSGPFPVLSLGRGPFYWVSAFNIYFCLILSMIILMGKFWHSARLYRMQISVILIGLLLMLTEIFLYLTGSSPLPQIDFAPFTFTLIGLLFSWALFRYHLISLTPIARDALVENLKDGILVFDTHLVIADANPAALRVLQLDPQNDWVGQPLNRALAQFPDMIEFCQKSGQQASQCETQINERVFLCNLSPLYDRHNGFIGSLLLISDITPLKRSETELRSLFAAMDRLVCVIDRQGQILEVPLTRLAEFQIAPQKLLNLHLHELFPAPLAEDLLVQVRQVMNEHISVEMEFPVAINGKEIWLSITISPLHKDRVLVLAQDISGRKQTEHALLQAKRNTDNANAELSKNLQRMERLNELSYTLNSTMEMNAILAEVVREANEVLQGSGCAIFLSQDENLVCGASHPFDLMQGPGAALLQKMANEALRGDVIMLTDEKGNLLLENEAHEYLNPPALGFIPLQAGPEAFGVLALLAGGIDGFSQGDILMLVAVGRRISAALEKARLFREMQALAQRDSLTSLSSRRHFFGLLEHEIQFSLRYHHPLSVIMLDIDHFKQVNDRFGHLAGDCVLKDLAALVRSGLRSVDMVGRYGGEEFVVAMPSTSLKLAVQTAERLRALVEMRHFQFEDQDIHITVSLGVAQFDPHSDASMDTMLQRADAALYTAKNNGRNCVETA